VACDSRRLGGGDVFVCLRGLREDGHRFAADAARAGAALVVGEEPAPPGVDPVPYLQVSDSRRALALLCCALHDHPSRSLNLTAYTGTNGKTSGTWMLHSIHREAGWPSAVLGTLGCGTPEDAGEPEGGGRSRGDATALPRVSLRAGPHTTPEAPDLQAELARWRAAGIRAGALEASSHGLALRRSYGTRFSCVVFTNLTAEHLDFHGSLEAYREAKARLFRREERGPDEPAAAAVVNADDPAAEALLRGSTDHVTRYGRAEGADVRLRSARSEPEGVVLSIRHPGGDTEIRSTLLGDFQVDNLLASFAAGCALGLDPATVARGLERLRGVPGRMERVDRGQPFPVLVDYAHTPDALRRACASLRSCTRGRLLLVFGCGGERDRGKRPAMGAIAARGADRVVLTDDNPRGEPPEAIRADVRAGIEEAGGSWIEIGDREAAIRAALSEARPGDTVLIAGKGHETGQIRGGRVLPFDDREVAGRLLAEVGA
jgi:UDP-N-acetylmuramoyl-L-alanyl-D-glutamate--2,6-diaminopimelate ligase